MLSISCNTIVNSTSKYKVEDTTTTAYTLITPTEFQEKINSEKGLILDVRTPQEYKDGHLKNAQLINFLEADFNDKINQLDKSQPIYLYCRSGNRSAKANEILSKNGFKTVYELEGGILAWEKAGFPIVN